KRVRRAALVSLLLVACTGTVGEAPPSARPPPEHASWAAPNQLRRLLARQYRAAVENLLGTGAAELVQPPQDATVNGYDAIGASTIAISSRDANAYERSAIAAATFALDGPGAEELVGCPLDEGGEPCLRAFAARFGRLA